MVARPLVLAIAAVVARSARPSPCRKQRLGDVEPQVYEAAVAEPRVVHLDAARARRSSAPRPDNLHDVFGALNHALVMCDADRFDVELLPEWLLDAGGL